MYSYSALQASSMSGTKSSLRVKSAVEVLCDSVGKYKSQQAKKYCFRVTKTTITSKEGMERYIQVSRDADILLSGPFCFIQTQDGKIASVYRHSNEATEVTNFKKGIAAAFQANFKNTQVELEEDTQSKHYSRYSYETIAPEHVKMHRLVDSESVVEYSSQSLNGKPVKLERSETLEYKKEKLLMSQGTTLINLNGPAYSSGFESNFEALLKKSADTFDPSFGEGDPSAAGVYSLRLQSCSKKPSSFRRRSIEQQSSDFIPSSLQADFERETGEMRVEEMGKIRKRVPSVRKALDGLKANLSDATTSNLVKRLLILESEQGSLPGYELAVSEVVNYLNSEKNMEMRALLYSFLAAEGSANSQKIIINAIKATTDRKERNSLTVQLAFVRNIRPKIATEIEKLIRSTDDVTDSLILSYGALAASSPGQRNRIVAFLEELARNAECNTPLLIHIIHSLGNTESNHADGTLLRFIAHENLSVRAATVYALRYSIKSKDVQDVFIKGLKASHDIGFVEMVLRALIAGAESKQRFVAVSVGDALFDAVMQHTKNNTNLRSMVHHYVMLLGRNAPKHWTAALSRELRKRGTVWDDSHDPLYNLVEDYSTRESDVSDYPANKAYIWSKSFGVSSIKLDVAVGTFAGFGGSDHPNNYKLFAGGVARGYAFGHTATAFDAQLLSENRQGAKNIVNRLYISIIGKVLVYKSDEIPTCKDWNYPLYNSPDYTLFRFEYSIFIYVGTVDFTIGLSVKLGSAASLSACISECITAKGGLTASVTVAATAGASVTLILLVRGGIDISGHIEYRIQPQMSADYQLPKGPLEICLKLRHGWPNNGITIYPYYQFRTLKWCKGWFSIPYPCGFSWGDKHKWNAATVDWRLSSSPMATLWSSCNSEDCRRP